MIQRVKGTHDWLDLRLFTFVVRSVSEFIMPYHFHEIATPLLEPLELFKRSLGLHTDVVTKEMFVIAREGEDKICLRPEATAPTMRAYLEGAADQVGWRVFSCGPMFRHERPQKGRYRQFHQINIEIINAASISYDASLLVMMDRLFQNLFKLDNFALIINFLGCPSDREQFKKTFADYLHDKQDAICSTCRARMENNLLRVFDCKSDTCQVVYRAGPKITDALCTDCAQEWQELQSQLDLLSVPYTIVPTLVRGLDYYDKTVFEFISMSLGAQNAFCSGGRYDHLATQIGASKDVPAVGVALGIERLMLLLEPIRDQLPLPPLSAVTVVIPIDPAQHALAQLLTTHLIAQGICIDLLFDGSLKSRMRRAHKLCATYAIIIGEHEQQNGTAIIKNMVLGTQQEVKQIDVGSHIQT